MNAQQQFKCYHLQEFRWNSETKKNDKNAERTDQSIFKIDVENKSLMQIFEDGTSLNHKIIFSSYDSEANAYTYKYISPSDGYSYVFKINSLSHSIDLSVERGGNETLLKKYLYKN